jgi:type 1 fimbria pilin
MRYYTGSVSDNDETTIYLTSDGTAEGTPCKIEVSGDDAFADDASVNVNYGADGSPHFQSAALNKKGISFEIKILYCPVDVKDSLDALIAPTRSTSATVRVRLNSIKRDIDVQAKAAPQWTSTGAWSGDIINDVVYRFISTGAGA